MSLFLFLLRRAEERETTKATNDIQKRVDKRRATLLEHFAKKQKTDWHFSMVWTMDTFENSVQRNCVDNMTLNSLECLAWSCTGAIVTIIWFVVAFGFVLSVI